jgi:hypothetical protein
MKLSTLENTGDIETINSSTGRATREQRRELRQKSILRSLNDCYCLAKSRWKVVGLAGFRSFLVERLDPQVP